MSVRWFSWSWRTWCCRIWGGSRSSWCTLTVVRWRHEVVCRNSVGRFCKAASAPGKGVGSADDRPDGDVGGAETIQKAFGLSDQTLPFRSLILEDYSTFKVTSMNGTYYLKNLHNGFPNQRPFSNKFALTLLTMLPLIIINLWLYILFICHNSSSKSALIARTSLLQKLITKKSTFE
jgi:hypothetical protein